MNSKYNVEDPNICPHCHVANIPSIQWQSPTLDTNNNVCSLSSWRCRNIKCDKIFIAQYNLSADKFIFTRFLNGFPKGPAWPQPILDLNSVILDADGKSTKSKFIKIYLQSLQAESYGLDEIAGMGYRKAIEYLVKDWAIQNAPEDHVKIKKFWLGTVIKDYYEGDLKDILNRATWLGNDQSHYIKLFEEYDIDVLKELINLIMVELDRQYKIKHYNATIKSKK